MTAVLALLALLLGVALGVAVLLWRAAVLDVRELQRTIRRQFEVIHRYRGEFFGTADAASPTAYAALQPDAEPPIPAAWLADLYAQPTTHDREYPR